jgi:hypothetical protein
VLVSAARIIARIHEAPTGRYHISDDAGPLWESGRSFGSRAEAIRYLRGDDHTEYTHYLAPSGRVVRIGEVDPVVYLGRDPKDGGAIYGRRLAGKGGAP